MKLFTRRSLCLLMTLMFVSSTANTQFFKAMQTRVVFHTSSGDFAVDLYSDMAPRSVENFLRYVEAGFYSGTIFHRVINGTIVQGGGFTEDMQPKPGLAPIVNEASPVLPNDAWTIAMARTNDPNSATSQFFVNLRDNPAFNVRQGNAGYAVFGKIVSGRSVLTRMGNAAIKKHAFLQDLPANPVVILSAEIQK